MSLYKIALAVFLVASGLFFLTVRAAADDFQNLCSVIAGIAALIAALLLLFGDNPRR